MTLQTILAGVGVLVLLPPYLYLISKMISAGAANGKQTALANFYRRNKGQVHG